MLFRWKINERIKMWKFIDLINWLIKIFQPVSESKSSFQYFLPPAFIYLLELAILRNSKMCNSNKKVSGSTCKCLLEIRGTSEIAAKENKYTGNHPFAQCRNKDRAAIQAVSAATHCSRAKGTTISKEKEF